MRSRRFLRGGRSSCHVPSRVLLCWRLCGSYDLPSGHLWQCDRPVELGVLGAVPVLCSRRDRRCVVHAFTDAVAVSDLFKLVDTVDLRIGLS